MVSFQRKLEQGLAECNIQVCHRLEDEPYQAVLVIGGTRASWQGYGEPGGRESGLFSVWMG